MMAVMTLAMKITNNNNSNSQEYRQSIIVLFQSDKIPKPSNCDRSSNPYSGCNSLLQPPTTLLPQPYRS